MAFEGREILDDNMCNRFHFGRDILFHKVGVHFTFGLLVININSFKEFLIFVSSRVCVFLYLWSKMS